MVGKHPFWVLVSYSEFKQQRISLQILLLEEVTYDLGTKRESANCFCMFLLVYTEGIRMKSVLYKGVLQYTLIDLNLKKFQAICYAFN